MTQHLGLTTGSVSMAAQGSPGMPSPTPERYEVMAFDEDGASVFGTFVGSDEQ